MSSTAEAAGSRSLLSRIIDILRLRAIRDLIDGFANSSPSRLALIVFSWVVFIFTALLMLPISSKDGNTQFIDALFTAVSAVCVTGLEVVSTGEHWSFFGQFVIIIGVQIGGLGILTLASVMGLAVTHRMGLRNRLIAANETQALQLGEVGTLLRIVATTSLVIEGTLFLILTPRFLLLGESFDRALWHGFFYSISAFNNAGFSPHIDGIDRYAQDPWILTPLAIGVFAGSLGFPVVLALTRNRWHYQRWDLHTKLTIRMTLIVFLVTVPFLAAFEWSNPATLGHMSYGERIWHSVFMSVMTRSGGFATFDIGNMTEESMLVTDLMMFIGGGSASTAGGIKVTTLAVLILAAVAEARGEEDSQFGERRIPSGTLRLAVSVALIGTIIVIAATLFLLPISGKPLSRVLFESISAFATVGLSTGLSAELPWTGKLVLVIAMFTGRVGTITLAAALALRNRRQFYRYPEERPIVG